MEAEEAIREEVIETSTEWPSTGGDSSVQILPEAQNGPASVFENPVTNPTGYQQHRQYAAYFGYSSDFQYPAPHFLTGGCVQQQIDQLPIQSYLSHQINWGQHHGPIPQQPQQGPLQNHSVMSDHNYNGNYGLHSHSQTLTLGQPNGGNCGNSIIQINESHNSNNSGPNQYQNMLHYPNQAPSHQHPYNNQENQPSRPASPPYAANSSNHHSNQHHPVPTVASNSRIQKRERRQVVSPGRQVTATRARAQTPQPQNPNSNYPNGLDVILRQTPVECHRFLTPQDVPDTARYRGYFTVADMLTLKRLLVNKAADAAASINMKNASNNDNNQGEQSKKKYASVITSLVPVPVSSTGSVSFVPVSSADNTTPDISSPAPGQVNMNAMGPPPPYRTANLVFKLLQIGNYQFRSFSEVNPNRLRVLFNSKRLTYECQLDLVRLPEFGMELMRKVLVVDIAFEQIRAIRFGTDMLFLHVEGSPIMVVNYNPSNDDTTCLPLTDQDNFLLNQIDNKQLKLSPQHTLFFLNERLVQLLHIQFRDHPRLRYMLPENAPTAFNNNEQPTQQQQQQQSNNC